MESFGLGQHTEYHENMKWEKILKKHKVQHICMVEEMCTF